MSKIFSVEVQCPYAIPCGDVPCVCIQRLAAMLQSDAIKIKLTYPQECPDLTSNRPETEPNAQ